ncbi:hypothetical protein Tco_0773726 [Tanacetum coccineum]|uniref:Uncharacterized protein n=1 Tax=Tanacetum coccineum TaxID=301880 RepID=A0ABQ4ZQ16_9ASTR
MHHLEIHNVRILLLYEKQFGNSLILDSLVDDNLRANRFEILLDEWEEGQAWQVTVTGSRLLLVAGPLFLQFLSAFLIQGTVSSISIIFSWGGSINPEGFLSSILLWLVIILAVVGVGVTVVVVIIVAVVVVVESSSVVKLSFARIDVGRDYLQLVRLLDNLCVKHSWQGRWVIGRWWIRVMAISVISISSDSSEDSVGTPAGRVILFGTIPTTIPDTTPVITPPATQTDTPVIPTETPIIAPTIPPSPDYTPASPDYSPASDSESDPSEDPSSDHIPPLPAISPFLSSDDDTTDSDTPDTPPSPTHGTPFTEITASTQRSPIIPRRRVMILSPGQPIPYSRPYRYHPNGPIHMMTARKRVGPFLVPQLAVGHPVDHSSSDYFSPDDSARDYSLDSSSEASSYFHLDASSDSSSGHSLSDHSSPNLPSTSAGPSRKRRRSPTTSVPALSLVFGALSPVRANLIPSPKRVKYSGYLADVEVDPKEISLRDDAIIRAVDRDETETGVRGSVEVRVERVTHPAMPEDIPEPAQEGAIEVTYETLGDLVQRVESAVTTLTERVAELERDNRKLRGTVSVESQRVDRLQRGMSRMQRELRQMRRLRFYDRVRVGRLEACARKHMGYRP